MGRYTTVFANQTAPLTESWNIGRTVLTSVLQARMLNLGLSKTLVEDLGNGLYYRFKNVGKNAVNGGKYSALGMPSCTTIITGLTKKVLSPYIPDLDKITNYGYALYDCYTLAKDELETKYNYKGDNNPPTIDGVPVFTDGSTSYSSPLVNGKFPIVQADVLTIGGKPYYFSGLEPYTLTDEHTGQPIRTCIRLAYFAPPTLTNPLNSGPIWCTGLRYICLETNYINKPVLRVTYTDVNGKTHAWYYELDGTYPDIDKIVNKAKANMFPCYEIRRDYKPIWDIDEDLFNLQKRVFKRCRIDWETIVGSYNGDREYIKDYDDKDKEYSDNLRKISNIIVTHAVDVTDNDPRVLEYLYSLFYDLGSEVVDNIFYNFEFFNLNVTWDSIEFSTHTGTKTKKNKYCGEGVKSRRMGTTGGQYKQIIQVNQYDLKLYHQVSSNTYTEITVTNIKSKTTINGRTVTRELPIFNSLKPRTSKDIRAIQEEMKAIEEGTIEDTSDDTHEFIIPVLPVICDKYMSISHRNELASISLRAVIHTCVRTKKKWYATKWFTVVRFVVYAVVIVVCAIWCQVALPKVLETISWMEIAIAALMVIAVKLLVKILNNVFNVDTRFTQALETIASICISFVSPLGAALGNFVWQAVSTGNITAEMGVDLLGGIAGNCLSGAMTYNGFAVGTTNLSVAMFNIASNPSTYRAVQERDWVGIASMAVSLICAAASALSTDPPLTSEDLKVGHTGTNSANEAKYIASGEKTISDVFSQAYEGAIAKYTTSTLTALTDIAKVASSAVFTTTGLEDRLKQIQSSYTELQNKNRQMEKLYRELDSKNSGEILRIVQLQYSLLKPKQLIPLYV